MKRVCSFIICLTLSTIVIAQDTLVFTIDIIRHGDRSPLIDIPKSSHHWPEGLGQLTPQGMLQEYQLGQRLRDEYVIKSHLLPKQYASQTLYVRSTDYDRTLMSAQSFLQGLYPLGSGPLLDNKQTFALPRGAQPIPIHTLPQESDSLLVYSFEKPLVKKLLAQYIYPTPAWKAREAALKPQYAHWSQATGVAIDGLLTLIKLADALSINQLYQIAPPEGLTKHDIVEIQSAGKWGFLTILKQPKLTAILSHELLTSIANELKHANNKRGLKSIFYFAHDTVISAMITRLGLTIDTIPRYASDLNFSLLENDHQQLYIKIKLNDHVLHIPACQQEACTVNEMMSLATSPNKK